MKSISSTLFIALLATTFSTLPALAATINVPVDRESIQDAIDTAEDGDTILVAEGIYRESINFIGKSITVQSVEGPNRTIIDGVRDGSAVSFVYGETEDSVLDGFTITNGNGTLLFYPHLGTGFFSGGGILCKLSSSTITNCKITKNYAAVGGGIYLRDASPTITNCVILKNWGTGLMHGGGAIYLDDSFPTITNCTLTANYAGQYGGGVFCNNSSPTITNSIIWNNFSIYDPEIHVRAGAPVVTYSDVAGGWSGEGNIDTDPLFIQDPWVYHLRPDSPCIDSGTDAGVYTDMDGQLRPYGAGYDMGADEFSTEPCSVIATSGKQFMALYLIPVLAIVFLSRRRMSKE